MTPANDKWDGRIVMTPIIKRVGTRVNADGIDFGFQINDGPFVVTSSIACTPADAAIAAKIGGTI